MYVCGMQKQLLSKNQMFLILEWENWIQECWSGFLDISNKPMIIHSQLSSIYSIAYVGW